MPARAAAAGRPRAPVPARLAARGRSDARTAAPRPPSERRVRRDHDFCLQAGFPPGHYGRGPPASSRPNVSGVPGGTCGRAGVLPVPPPPPQAGRPLSSLLPGAPRRARQAPGRRLGISRLPWAPEPPLGLGSRDSALTCRAARGQGSGIGCGDRRARPAGRERGPASGARCPGVWVWGWPAGRGVPGRSARVHAPVFGNTGLLELWWLI